MLELVEGNALASTEAEPIAPERAIIPDAFEQVLARVREEEELYPAAPAEPVYKNRVLIGVACLLGGLLLGKLTTEPKIIEKIVEKTVPGVAKTEQPLVAVANPFRKFSTTKEFDPWQPLNGGLPLPPPETQARIIDRGAMAESFGGADFSSRPPSLRGSVGGDVGIFDPGLPATNGAPGLPAPNEKFPGEQVGKTQPEGTGKPAPAAQVASQTFIFSVGGPEPSAGQNRALGIAGANGGTGRSFTHMNEEGSIEAQGVLLIVPSSATAKVKEAIEALGGASVTSSMDGADHQGAISGQFNSRLKQLRDKRAELLKDFEESAPSVKQITEAIDQESRAVSATRLPGGLANKSVFLILLR